MATAAKRGKDEVQPIIVKKVVANDHGAPHGGQWKVAYADFVTAMMAFFLLLWLLGTTDEAKKKGLADYFTPTLLQMNNDKAGSDGLLGGQSLSEDELPHMSSQHGAAAIALPSAASTGKSEDEAKQRNRDRRRFEMLRKTLVDRMDRTPELRQLKTHVRFSETPEGLRIDLVDEADFSMFKIGTDRLLPQALALVHEVAGVIRTVPNEVIVRGHTDSLPYAAGRSMNNWMLSTARAEATRMALSKNGIAADRFARIEGVADREPYTQEDLYDPRNRRMAIILTWSEGEAPPQVARVSQPAARTPSAKPNAG